MLGAPGVHLFRSGLVVFYNIMYIDVLIIFDIRMHNKCITMSLHHISAKSAPAEL